MEAYKKLRTDIMNAGDDADKFYVNENMQAGKRLFSKLMNIERQCKEARVELSNTRKIIRERRKHGRN